MVEASIWYRHWLEMRNPLRVLALGAMLIALRPGSTISGLGPSSPDGHLLIASTFEQTGPMFQAIQETRLARSISSEELFVWAVFTERVAVIFAMVVGLLLMGNGLAHAPGFGSAYTLTLPVSRSRLMCTRFLANCVTGTLLVALALVAECVILAIQGRGVPFIPMALSVAFAVPILMAWNAVVGAIATSFHVAWAVLAVIPLSAGFVFSEPWLWRIVTTFPARGEMPWVALAALLAITSVAFAVTMQVGRTKEF